MFGQGKTPSLSGHFNLQEWPVSYFICEECAKLLDVAYSFREACLKAEEERQKSEDPQELREEVKEEQEVDKEASEVEDYAASNSDQDEQPETISYGLQRKKKRKKLQFSCEKCDKVFNSSIKLVNHCVSDHDMQKLDVRPFICDR